MSEPGWTQHEHEPSEAELIANAEAEASAEAEEHGYPVDDSVDALAESVAADSDSPEDDEDEGAETEDEAGQSAASRAQALLSGLGKGASLARRGLGRMSPRTRLGVASGLSILALAGVFATRGTGKFAPMNMLGGESSKPEASKPDGPKDKPPEVAQSKEPGKPEDKEKKKDKDKKDKGEAKPTEVASAPPIPPPAEAKSGGAEPKPPTDPPAEKPPALDDVSDPGTILTANLDPASKEKGKLDPEPPLPGSGTAEPAPKSPEPAPKPSEEPGLPGLPPVAALEEHAEPPPPGDAKAPVLGTDAPPPGITAASPTPPPEATPPAIEPKPPVDLGMQPPKELPKTAIDAGIGAGAAALGAATGAVIGAGAAISSGSGSEPEPRQPDKASADARPEPTPATDAPKIRNSQASQPRDLNAADDPRTDETFDLFGSGAGSNSSAVSPLASTPEARNRDRQFEVEAPIPKTKGRIVQSEPDRNADRVEATPHRVERGQNFWSISREYYGSGRYYIALWAANQKTVPVMDKLREGQVIIIPDRADLDPSKIEPAAAAAQAATAKSRPSRTVSNRRDARQLTAVPDRQSPKRGRIEEIRDEEDDPFAARGRAMANSRPRERDIDDGLDRASDTNTDRDAELPIHKVRPRETLRSIARDRLGDSKRANEIYRLNRSLIDDPSNLVSGQILELPEDAKPGRR